MPDNRLEGLVRQSLRDEAASLPFTISDERLARRLAERQRRVGPSARILVAAAVAGVAIIGAGGLFLLGSMPRSLVGASPSPTPDTSGPTTALPESAALLTDYPMTTLLLHGSAGPANPGAGTAESPDRSPIVVDVGRTTIDGPFVLATVCRGQGDLSIKLDDGSGTSTVQVTTPCDGEVRHREYLSQVPVSGPNGFAVSVSASPASSWRFALGRYPADLGVEPEFPPVAITPGWDQLADSGLTLISATAKTGVSFEAPADATQLGVLVTCQGDATVAFESVAASIDPVACGGRPSTHRFEIAATGGQQMIVRATADGFVWIRLTVEASGDQVATYPDAPALPAALADTPYAESSGSMVGIGTIGGNRQVVLPLRQARPGASTGEVVPVAILDEATGSSRLDLLSIRDGTRIATVATVQPPGLLLASWVDAEHRQVFYVVTPDQQQGAIRYHQVAFDGTGDRVLAEATSGAEGYLLGETSADLALDTAAFVMNICDGTACKFAILDLETGDLREVERRNEAFCSISGIAGGTVVAVAMDACTPFDPGYRPDAPARIVAVPLDGGSWRDLLDGVAGGRVVDMPTGPRFIFARTDAQGNHTVEALDLGTGAFTTLRTQPATEPFVAPMPVRLPDGWVLLASMSLGDFPQASIGPRAVPILLNLVTGESYEMVNLPH